MPEIKETFVAFGDTHFGTIVKSVMGRYVSQKTHAPKAIKSMLHFVEDFQPSLLIHGGDHADFFPISHWTKNRIAELSRTSLQDDLQTGIDLLLEPLEQIVPSARKEFLIGNHDDWFFQFIAQYPQLADSLSFGQITGLTSRGWRIHKPHTFLKEGKLTFTHGDALRSPKYHAEAAVSDFMRNMVYFHRHTLQVIPKLNPTDEKDTKIGWAIPGLCNLNPHYTRTKANVWMHGFCYGYILTNGHFSVYPVVMDNFSFTLNGKVYKP